MGQINEIMKAAQVWIIDEGPNILIALAIIIIGRRLVQWAARLIRKPLEKSGPDQTLANFLTKLVYYGLLVAVILAAADQAGIKTTSFLAILGAAGLAVGLALKDSLSNFASGLMLILFRPFRVGDGVTIAGVTGKVERIDIFSTMLLTPDNQKIIVPNSSVTSNIITNITAEPIRRLDLVIGIGYDDDIKLAKETIAKIIRADTRILDDPAPTIALGELALPASTSLSGPG